MPKVTDNWVDWSYGEIPKTTLSAHVTGWTILDNVYVLNGSFHIVTDDPTAFPFLREMISSGYEMKNGKAEVDKQEPTENDMVIIDPQEATRRFGQYASRVAGVSFVSNDPPQFSGHYYHFTAEIFLGLWRTYSTLDQDITADGKTSLPAPTRLIMPHCPHDRNWHDKAGINHIVLRAAFPSLTFEYMSDWEERALTGRPVIMDRVVLTGRTTAHRAKNFSIDDKIGAVACRLPASPHWWTPIRRNVVAFAGAGKLPPPTERPVITYISRQGRGRSLDPKSHESLVKALRELESKYGYEVNIVVMEKFTKLEQIWLAARTTILIGVHGNGLTSLLWMQPNPSATVIEIFFANGFASDYQVPARDVGIEHYGVWNDHYFRSMSEHKPKRHQPRGFHDKGILAHGPTIAELCLQRIMQPERLASKMDGVKQVLPS
ncbi:hypothetical protein FRB98_007411 [Tulasnella sp. 332]|nr:hypothetical protein FRB98_007411 [Tulasnella sp. 332]